MANHFAERQGRLTLRVWEAQAPSFPSHDEKPSQFAEAGGVRVLAGTWRVRCREPFLASQRAGRFATPLFGTNRSGDSRSAGTAARATAASIGLSAGSRGTLVGGLVPRCRLQIRPDHAAPPRQASDRPRISGAHD